jgi:hypothetical protein
VKCKFTLSKKLPEYDCHVNYYLGAICRLMRTASPFIKGLSCHLFVSSSYFKFGVLFFHKKRALVDPFDRIVRRKGDA